MLVLNATYEPINVCTVRRAVVLLLKDKAEVIEHGERNLRSASSSIQRPVVIRLVTYVRIPRDTHRRKITRRAVFARDELDVPVLRRAVQPDRRPRDPEVEGRGVELGEHRRLVRAVQPPQGRRAAAPGRACGCSSSRAQPHATVFIHVSSPTIPSAWHQYLAA